MKELVPDGVRWKARDDVYDAFFAAVGAPSWHGRNFDALNDSIATGSINSIEIPYRIVVRNFDLISGEAVRMTNAVADLIAEIASRGCPVEIEIRDSSGTLVWHGHSNSQI
jgi:RNAse (barnase) inhibitor barstar